MFRLNQKRNYFCSSSFHWFPISVFGYGTKISNINVVFGRQQHYELRKSLWLGRVWEGMLEGRRIHKLELSIDFSLFFPS